MKKAWRTKQKLQAHPYENSLLYAKVLSSFGKLITLREFIMMFPCMKYFIDKIQWERHIIKEQLSLKRKKDI